MENTSESRINRLEEEVAILQYERDQADKEVLKLEEAVRHAEQKAKFFEEKLKEWEELEAWRQAHMDKLRAEAHNLSVENEQLKRMLKKD